MRLIRITSLLLVVACALSFVGCQHTASNTAQPNQAAGNQAQPANSQAQPANAQAQPPAQAQPTSEAAQPAEGSDQSAANGTPAPSTAPAPPAPDTQPNQNAQTQAQPVDNTAQNQPRQVAIPDGTPIDIRLTQSLGSARSASGQAFAATLDAPIVVNNAVVVARGAHVTGRVLYAKHSGRLKGPAELAVTLTSLEVDGQSYRIVTSHRSWRGKSHKKRDLAWMGGGGGAGSLIGAVAGGGVGAAIGAGVGAGGGTVTAFITGRKNIVLPSETRLRFVLRKRVVVSEG